MNQPIRVCFLPVAGKECPHQMLTMHGLSRDGRFEVRHGVDARFFAGTRTCLKQRPDILYFDWIHRYCMGRSRLVTILKMLVFFLDIQIVTKIFRVPIYWTLHNLRSHERAVPDGWERLMQRYLARHTTRIRVFSENSIERVIARLGVDRRKLMVLPEGNYTGYYPNEISRADARARLNLPTDEFVLLWLGNIRPYKGLSELIDAFRQVAQPNWRLVIAGQPYIESYAAQIIESIKADERMDFYPRFIPENELQVFYNAADAVALPFTEIENSASLTMTMGFRKPVVAPDLGVVGERLCRQRELVYGADGLVAALQRLAALTPARLAEIGQANFDEVRKYKWEDVTQLLEAGGSA